MLRIVPALIIVGLTLYCLFDVLGTDRRRLNSASKAVWLLVVLLPVIGAVLWLGVGKPSRAPTARGAADTLHLRRRDRIVAPDDDPAFLRTLDERAWRARRAASLEHKAVEHKALEHKAVEHQGQQHNPPAGPGPAATGTAAPRARSDDVPPPPLDPASGDHSLDADGERPSE